MSRARVLHSREEVLALLRVTQAEFEALGLLTPGVRDVPLKTPLTDLSLDLAYASYFLPARRDRRPRDLWMRLNGQQKGQLVVPLVSIQSAMDRFQNRRETLRGTLRHELAHVLAYTSGRLVIDDPKFERAFGYHHETCPSVMLTKGSRHYVSEIAKQDAGEDFAETLRVYVRCAGDVVRYKKRPTWPKFEYVSKLPGRIRARGMRAQMPLEKRRS